MPKKRRVVPAKIVNVSVVCHILTGRFNATCDDLSVENKEHAVVFSFPYESFLSWNDICPRQNI